MFKMQSRNRWLLVATVGSAQLACLALGLALFGSWLHARLSGSVQAQVLEDNRQVASQLASLIRETGISTPRRPSSAWDRMQSIVEGIKLPNDGFVCLVDSKTGLLLCHPDFRSNPQLATTAVGQLPLDGPANSQQIIQATQFRGAAAGWVTFPDGTQVVAAKAIPELGVTVLAHQRVAGMEAAAAAVVAKVWWGGLAAAVALTAFTTSVTARVTRRYENRLAEINEGLEEVVERRSQSLVKTRDAVIFALARLAETRDHDTGEHLDRIQHYVGVLAHRLIGKGIRKSEVKTLVLASSLHDIGKVGIPDTVLCKTGPYTPAERAMIQSHPTIGGNCLDAIRTRLGIEDDFLTTASDIALYHHEKWDGSGYPKGLEGPQIPLAARIVAVADVYDALTSERIYKPAMPHNEAVEFIAAASGTQFDPVVVEAFLKTANQFAKVAAQEITRKAA
jgi:response regulator RpfG family c-di-GMP phosphodiesterase